MDDSWGNILYLILMAIFVVVGALKKKKSQRPSVSVEEGDLQQPKSSSKGGLQSMLETLLGGEVPEVYEPVEAPAEAPVVQKQEKTVEEEYPDVKKMSIEYMDTPKKSALQSLSSIYDKHEEEELEESEETVDWRKAIIYKEILDRKYS